MEVRYTTDPKGFKEMTTDELRKSYFIETLFVSDEVPMIYSDIDRSITGSAVPVKKTLTLLSAKKEMAADFFAERREVGVVNIGDEGIIEVDGKAFTLHSKDALYIGRGAKRVEFKSTNAAQPAKYYFVSYPAHKEYATTYIHFADAAQSKLGSQRDANKRTIHKLIHPGSVQSCQLVMGLTELEEGNVWNTMPSHTHQRRSEVYMYFNVAPDALVVHLMGQPNETRHLIMHNEQAVLNPSWSIHTGVGTRNYSFIWAMGGENQVFDDMDGITIDELR
ncbi:MAG: 5-dehydro-4-deoxy-D-glucuronate isomerase [Ignavibacteriales bacterium]|nr:5-dehydro-4-deoxy-D-glucuronate isomerase [Ignavibacteriales bacterium]